MGPRSSRVITTQDERGRPPVGPNVLAARGFGASVAWIGAGAPAAVVGQRADRGERLGEGVDPLRPVHLGGAGRVGGAARIDQDVTQ
jgi:hypothetical protein